MKRGLIISLSIAALVALFLWAPDVYAFEGFDDGGGEGLPPCATCHPDLANSGPTIADHDAHAALSNNDCDSCHVNSGGPGNNNPPLANCVRCHGRDADAGGDNISAGLGRGLRQHHEGVEVLCGNCHSDATGPAGVGEDVLPTFYPQALGGAGLDPCDGSEEQFESVTISLDNDGDGLTDGADPDCAPPPECTVDADCDDGFFCNGAEVCDANGTCQAGTAPSCDDGVACTDDACDPSIDDCLNTPDDAACDDDDVCNGVETCDPVADCQAGTPLECDDGDLCTNDNCDPVAGCVFSPVECLPGELCDPDTGQCVVPPDCIDDSDCDDGMFCNGVEICDANGTCQPGTPVDCDDGVACTVDTCDEVNDVCASAPDNAFCDDGLFCTGAETCDLELDCQPGTPPDCDDGVACTDDACDPSIDDCLNTPDDAACDDDDVCTGIETCDPVDDCQAGTPLDCDDGDLCTNDSCDPVAGCVFSPVECLPSEQCDPDTGECVVPPDCIDDPDCDDGMFCNGAETCDTATGTCQTGTPVDCDDGVACTVDTCDEVNDECLNTPDNAFCDDGLFCTGDEKICDLFAGCVSTGDPCPAGTTCNEETDSCDVVSGKVTICHIPPGNPARARTLSINAVSVEDHLAHGDLLGPCP